MNGDNSDDDEGWSLMFPFVACQSNGGPFDDAAFCAGYEMGGFSQRCAVAASLNLLPFTITIRRDNVKQADMIAMQCLLAMSEVEMNDETHDEATIAEWTNVTVDWPEGETPP